jgi:ABC-type phosphate transport system auxiliary subunit
MDDTNIADRIEKLVAEEHRLQTREAADATTEDALDDDRRRLEQVEVELDRCWDLLRQRRARRTAGLDPDEAEVRSAETVERYQQ